MAIDFFSKRGIAITNWIANNLEVVVAIAALTASIFAIFMNIRAMRIQRIHNINSLRPLLTFICSDQNDRIRIQIKNIGLGPATIKAQRLYKSGALQRADRFVDMMPTLDGKNGRPFWTLFTNSLVGEALGAGSARNLIEFSGEAALKHPKTVLKIRQALATVEAAFDYQDLHGCLYECTSNISEKYARYIDGPTKPTGKST
ncbi:MAG: hypothetical protein AAF429_00155 [Pseudomonadota bacterium]